MKICARSFPLLMLVLCAACADSEDSPEVTDSGADVVQDSAAGDQTMDPSADEGDSHDAITTEVVDQAVEVDIEEVGPAFPDSLFLSDQFLNIAHRGGALLAPEETLVAFTRAVEVGADVLELDVHSTADGIVVIMHDETVDRTTDGTGSINSMSFEALRQLDAGYNFTRDHGATYPHRGQGLAVPTLEELLQAFPDMYFVIEIKQWNPSIVDEVLQILYDTETEDQVVIGSFFDDVLLEVREADPRILTSFGLLEMMNLIQLTEATEGDYEPPAELIQIPTEQGSVDLLEPEFQARVRRLGLKTHIWTINNRDEMERLMAMEIDGLITDDPLTLNELIEASDQ